MFLADDVPSLEVAEQSNQLAELVEAAFPDLRLGKRRLERSGGDHLLLIVDEHFAFRFPRTGMHSLNLEIAVLERLQRHSSVPTPAYQYVDPSGRFAGYPFIKGTALTPARFAGLAEHLQNDVLVTAGMFLTELHGLAASSIAPLQEWPSTWTAAEYADRGVTEHLPLIAVQMPVQACRVAEFYNRYRDVAPPQRVVVHGDLVVEHVLLNDATEQLSGIIDFGDVALGDPAQDFLGFWAFGAEAVGRVMDMYRPAVADLNLLARSRDHFVRYRLDRMFEGLSSGDRMARSIAAEIDTLLTV